MSKRELQKNIRDNDGFILSDGTMNLQHLLPKAFDLISDFNLRKARHGIGDLKTSIIECFDINGKVYNLFQKQYYGEATLKEYRHGDIALDPYDVWSACEDFFNSIAPNGYYFGSNESDGACIGWFKYEEE